MIPIKAVLGTSKISVSDFVNLQVGDVIKIDKKVDQELEVYVVILRSLQLYLVILRINTQ